jgi:uncharacterized protein (TIGR02300 family)
VPIGDALSTAFRQRKRAIPQHSVFTVDTGESPDYATSSFKASLCIKSLQESPLAKPELGTKRVCPTTGRKFYDLNRDPVVSPYSGESWPRASFEPLLKSSAAANDDEEETADPASAAAEFVPLEEAEPVEAKDVVADDIEIDEEIAPADEDDTFLEAEEEGDDDVTGLIDGEIEGDEET